MFKQKQVITGLRPTGNLTVANYLGAVKPLLDLLERGYQPMIFVADMHALTDFEPQVVKKYSQEIIADYLALGLDPKKATIFVQSDIMSEVASLTILLARLIKTAELLRVPTLKEKLKAKQKAQNANALLLLYPVMMAADILLQRASKVPVGQDQIAHLEVSRQLARKFNKKYGKVFPVPKPLQVESLKILSLRGKGKMSKSQPKGAIFLTDKPSVAEQKIKKAQTAVEGAMNEKIASHVLLAKGLAKNKAQKEEIDALIKKHQEGQAVMGQFKKLLNKIVQDFLVNFQKRRKEILSQTSLVEDTLKQGAEVARKNAQETLNRAKKAMDF